jgi:hypothetical protein
MTEYCAYYWVEHDGINYGLKMTRDVAFGEDTPLFMEVGCLTDHCEGPVRVPAVTKQRYEYLRALE